MKRYHAMPVKIRQGFTLIEMVVAIVVTGIVAAMVSSFVRTPIQSYLDSVRRAEITDAADTALRRMSRDLHLALPNSIRTPNTSCFEFIPTITGGRYRADLPGDFLDFTQTDASFAVLGNLNPVPAANDRVVIYNLGIDGADAYRNQNMATIASATANTVTLSAATLFPIASPGHRFYVVPNAEQAVFYNCDGAGTSGGDGTGILYRFSGYGFNPGDPTTCPAVAAGTAVLARNVSACSFTYAPGVTQRSGLVSMQMSITKNGETATLYHEVHVNNVP